MKIRRNKDGQQNLNDLRKALAECQTASVHKLSGNWVVSKLVQGNTWFETPTPHYYDERMAIQKALFGEVESKDEVLYYKGK